MRLVTFEREGEMRVGAETGRGIVDFAIAAPALPRGMIELLAAGRRAMQTARAVCARALDDGVGLAPAASVRLRAPVPRPGKILGIALNYRDHAAETGRSLPAAPSVFAKASTAVIGPGDGIEIPSISQQIDYEGELAVVIGMRVRGVQRSAAAAAIAGYTIMNDVTARDVQARSGPSLAKSFDTFAPMGPALVTADELADPGCLALRTLVNGEQRQGSNTAELVFDVPALIVYLSAAMTLEPGDLITTGTPAGVGVRRTPPQFLQPGDRVCVEISGLGVLENPVVGRRGS
jgi:2-keto-4-pentenoate hydratase/2-oxohepta-3-ene-1,7-dioic acid hydratase in catechol pathway